MRPTRRDIVMAGMATLAAGALPRAALAATPNLAGTAGSRGLAFGSAFDREIFDDPAAAALLTAQCRIGAIENSLKFDWLRPAGPEADFTDQALARANIYCIDIDRFTGKQRA